MNKNLSPAAVAIISLIVIGLIYYALTSAKIADMFAHTPLFALAMMGTVGGLVVTGLVLFSAKKAIKKRRK